MEPLVHRAMNEIERIDPDVENLPQQSHSRSKFVAPVMSDARFMQSRIHLPDF